VLDTNASPVTSFGEILPVFAPRREFGLGRPLSVNVSLEIQSNSIKFKLCEVRKLSDSCMFTL
jgi:hypothetical protein